MADDETPSTQRPRRCSSPLGHAQTVEFVKLMDAMDYDGTDRGPYEYRNVHKLWVLEKVRDMLVRQFHVVRTNNQLQKRWSDLKLKEPDRLEGIRREIADQGETQTRKRGRSRQRQARRTSAASPPTPPSPEASAVAEETPSPEDSESSQQPQLAPGPESDDEDVEGMDLSMSSSSHLPPKLLKTEEEEDDDVVFVPPASTAAPPLTAEILALKAMGAALQRQSSEITTEFYSLGRQFLTLSGKVLKHNQDQHSFNERILHLSRGADGAN